MSIEAQVTRHGVACIGAIEYDQVRSSLKVQFVSCSNPPLTTSTLTFNQLQEYSDTWHAPEYEQESAEAGDSLLGIAENPVSGGIRYIITTLYREIILLTEQAPTMNFEDGSPTK